MSCWGNLFKCIFFYFYFWNLKNIQNSVWALSRAEGETLEIFLNAMYIYWCYAINNGRNRRHQTRRYFYLFLRYFFYILFLEFKEHPRFGLSAKFRWKGDSGNIVKEYLYFDAGGTFDFKSSAGGNLMLICDLTKFV